MVDTKHFKGNYPDSCAIDCCVSLNDEDVINNKVDWKPLLNNQKLSADNEHYFEDTAIENHDAVTHIKLKIYPDGGISRLRIFGNIIKG